MKTRQIILALALIITAAVVTSCQHTTCPAYKADLSDTIEKPA